MIKTKLLYSYNIFKNHVKENEDMFDSLKIVLQNIFFENTRVHNFDILLKLLLFIEFSI